MTNFNIQIVSDTVCPWCYVGKNKFERGIAAYKALHPSTTDTFTVTWRPFYLNAAAPKNGMDKMEFFKSKFPKDKLAFIFERMSAVGHDVGINFKYGGRTGNTRDSHRLVQLGKTKGQEFQTRVVEELFKSYFEEEGDITSHDVLKDAGLKAGLKKEEVEDWLQTDKGGPEVDKEVLEAQTRGVNGVPNFIFQGKFEISGAQDAQAFVKAFERVKELEGS